MIDIQDFNKFEEKIPSAYERIVVSNGYSYKSGYWFPTDSPNCKDCGFFVENPELIVWTYWLPIKLPDDPRPEYEDKY